MGLAVLAAGAAAAPVQATEPDPVLALVERAERFQRQVDAFAAVGDSEGAGHSWHLRWLADDDVLATRPSTVPGLVQQLKILANCLHGSTRVREDGDDLFRCADFAEALGRRAI